MITLYVSLDGELKDVYNILTAKSFILSKLGESLLVSNIIVIHNDVNTKSQNRLIKNKSDFNNIENMLDNVIKYRNDLVNIKEYYNLEFIKAYQEKSLFNEEKQLIDSGSYDLFIPENNLYIRKKHKRPNTQDFKKTNIDDLSKKHKFIRLQKQFNKIN